MNLCYFDKMNGKTKLTVFWLMNLLWLLPGAGLVGCVHHQEFSGSEQRALATPPNFLIGPMALLLTNAGSYSAQIRYETTTAWGSTQAVGGNFTAAGNKLAFEPELPKASRKNLQRQMVFVWDTGQGAGYALNDALQGYAPYSGTVRFTNITTSQQSAVPVQIAGHECEEESAMVFGNDGSTNLLRVWRAPDLRGFPLRISGGTNSSWLTFSKIRFGEPARFLMSSEGYTKYESADAMVTELVAREHNLTRRSDTSFGYPANFERTSRPGQPY
jgi:hypothetical protein